MKAVIDQLRQRMELLDHETRQLESRIMSTEVYLKDYKTELMEKKITCNVYDELIYTFTGQQHSAD